MESERYLDLKIRVDKDGFEIDVYEPESSNYKALGRYSDNTEDFLKEDISREILSWVSIWRESEEEYLSKEEFNAVKAELKRMADSGWKIPNMVACIYDLYQDYIISNVQEEELYALADPFADYNECSKYYEDMDYENPLRKVIGY